jgi:hypothetical protein
VPSGHMSSQRRGFDVKFPAPQMMQSVAASKSWSNVPGLQDLQSASVAEPAGAYVSVGHLSTQRKGSDVKPPALQLTHGVPGLASSSYIPALPALQSLIAVEPIAECVPGSHGRHLVGEAEILLYTGS